MIGLGVVVFAGLLSLSRGGAVAMVVAGTVAITILVRTSIPSKKQLLVSLGAVGLVLSVALAIFGYDRVSTRLDDFSSGSLDRLDGSLGRRVIWGADLRAILDAPLFGWGAAAIVMSIPCTSHGRAKPNTRTPKTVIFKWSLSPAPPVCSWQRRALPSVSYGAWPGYTARGRKWPTFVVPASAGIRPKGPPKGGTTNAGSRRAIGCFAAVAGSLAANAVHALVDFVWDAPGCMVIVILLAAAACRLYQIAGFGQGFRKRGQAPFVRRPTLRVGARRRAVPAKGACPLSQSPGRRSGARKSGPEARPISIPRYMSYPDWPSPRSPWPSPLWAFG